MKCQPYVSSREAIRLSAATIADTAPTPYLKPGRGKDKGRMVLGRVNHYTYQPVWASRKLRKALKVTAHRLYRHRAAQALRTDYESEIPNRISVSMLY